MEKLCAKIYSLRGVMMDEEIQELGSTSSLEERQTAITDRNTLDVDSFWKNYPLLFGQPATQQAVAV